MSNIQAVEIGTNVYAPPSAQAIELFSFNGAENMTLAQLILAVCLQRADAVEKTTVVKSNEVAQTSGLLKALGLCCSTLLADSTTYIEQTTLDLTDTGYTPTQVPMVTNVYDFITKELGHEVTLRMTTKDVEISDEQYRSYLTNISDKNRDSLISQLQSSIPNPVTFSIKNVEMISTLGLSSYTNLFEEPTVTAYLYTCTSLDSIFSLNECTGTIGDLLCKYFIGYTKTDSATYHFYKPTIEVPTRAPETYDDKMALFNTLKRDIEDATNLSEEKVIDLQSYVNRRDVVYNMSSSIAGACINGATFVANNF